MYSIFADNTAFENGKKVCIYNDVTPLSTYKVISPKLTMEDSAAGSLEFTLPPGNAGYDIINPMTTDIVVLCDTTEIWRGRVLNEDIDFYKRKKLYCEGELAFFNDTIQPPAKYTTTAGTTVRSFLESLVSIHNENVAENRQFTVGICTVTDGDSTNDDNQIYRYTNYETTLKCINEKLVDSLGGHLRVRHADGVRYLDYLKDDDETFTSADQVIQFGKNLLDYTQSFTMDDLATVIVPRGARLDTETIEGLEDYLTVKSVNDDSIYVASDDAVKTYGRIIAVVDWDSVTDASTLLTKAKKYLSEEQFDKMSLEISMVDLHYLDPSIRQLSLLEKVRCVSLPHGMDKTFQVTKMEINLAEPDNSTYTLGTDTTKSLTQATSKANSELAASIDSIPTESEILTAAKNNTFAILQANSGGYVSFTKNDDDQITEIKITDNIKESESRNMWRWNNAGLYHFHRDTYQEEWAASSVNAAIDMSGHIYGDYITGGKMTAVNIEGTNITGTSSITGATITGGTITQENGSDYVRIGSGTITAANSWIDLRATKSSDSIQLALGCHNSCCRRAGEGYHRQLDSKWIMEAAHNAEESSDKRLKREIETIDTITAKELITNVRPVSFKYIESEDEMNSNAVRYGVIAQEVREVLDKIGQNDAYLEHDRYEKDGTRTIEYKDFISPLIACVKDLYEQIDQLKGELNG